MLNQPDPLFDIGMYGGRGVCDRDLPGFRIVGSRIRPADADDQMHGHRYAYLSWIFRGSTRERFLEGPDRYGKIGVPYFHPMGERHAVRVDEPSLIVAVRLKNRYVLDLTTRYGSLGPGREIQGAAAKDLSARILTEAVSGDPASDLALTGLVHELLAIVVRDAPSDAEDWLARIDEMIRESWSSPLNLSAIASEVGRHPSHVSREFRKRFGHTPGDHLKMIRLERARLLLTGSERTIVQISGECGFYDESHFARQFRERFGTSPTQYRARSR